MSLGSTYWRSRVLKKLMRRERPDLVFLDVRMPEYDGFDILERWAPRRRHP